MSISDSELLVEAIREFNWRKDQVIQCFYNKFRLSTPLFRAVSAKQIPRIGGLKVNQYDRVNFKFHGRGCEIRYSDGVVVDFDFHGLEFDYIAFGSFKLHKFILSNPNTAYNKLIDEHGFYQLIERLELNGWIERLNPLQASFILIE